MASSSDKWIRSLTQRRATPSADKLKDPDGPITAASRFTQALKNRAQRIIDEQQQAEDQPAKRTVPTTPGGAVMDANLAAAKAAYDASLKKPAQPAQQRIEMPAFSTLLAVIKTFCETPRGKQIYPIPTTPSLENLCNDVLEKLAKGARLSVELVAERAEWQLTNGFVELPANYSVTEDGTVVRKRGTVSRPAPKRYPKYLSPDDQVQQQLDAIAKDQAARQAAYKADAKLSDEELNKKYRAALRPRKPGDPEYGAV